MKANFITRNVQAEVLCGNRTVCGPTWANGGRDIHSDPFSRLYWIQRGRGEIVHMGGRLDLHPGRLFVIPEYTPARYRATEGMILYWIHFNARLFGCMELFSVMNWAYSVTLSSPATVGGLWKTMIRVCESRDLEDSLRAGGILRELLSYFAAAGERHQAMNVSGLQRFLPAITFIEQNLSRRLRLEEVAATVSLSPAYFCHLFSKTVGQSPVDFINRKRIERAQFLLLGEKQPLKTVASEVGFDDVYYFSRVFRKTAGLSPAQYRRQQKHME